MEVMLWQLRRDGEKLPSPEGPVQGWLRLERLNVAGEVTLHADLYASASQGAPAILQGLSHVEVRKLDERGILLYGLQHSKGAGPLHKGERQAWFGQPVAG